jgi:hypothetical protein
MKKVFMDKRSKDGITKKWIEYDKKISRIRDIRKFT